ncbi:MAG TPA: DNA-binding response regulator [Gemmatimonas aurantiaca]|uniref:OmpR family two-component response regulator n=2 Tax=Gemmatimonas aurantiaca TaxID=173480 RepID=C1ACF3_GEMAT|nr:response regulator transcription factor [Gemmatimonas aurantiaca]BAH40180.1 OmpR family two-component response regulator [Gemmatimonas aurantiaca T-27]HCT57810.1 DNA-binding response regulator [Gemmatimonas aurantiaca]
MRILLAEDDTRLHDLLARALRERAFAVDVVADGEAAIIEAAVNDYDAIILDVTMPRRSGLEVCAELRKRGKRTPILMLTARDALTDRVAGLDAGADDYLVKPFELDELLARLRAIMRRGPVLQDERIVVGDLVVDTRAQQATRAGVPLNLTTREYTLLAYLARQAGRVIGRAELTDHVWDANHDPASNALEVYVGRVRKKLESVSDTPLLHTRRGAGYLLSADVTD